jgi:hypothetical protein
MLCTMAPTPIAQLLDDQLAVVSRGQLLTLGMSDNAMQYRIRAGGPWQVLLPGVYLGTTGAPNLVQKEMAALLYAGPGSLITGQTALLHYSMRVTADPDTVDVLVPIERQRRSTAFVRIHRTARMPDRISSVGPVRLVPAARAVADTARQLTSLRDVRAVAADAVQRGRCTLAQLASELATGPIRGSAKFRSVLAEVAEGIRSTAEGEIRDLIKAARLPMPLFNPSLYDGETFIAKPDAWWPEAGVAAETDSREWHLNPADWERTMARHDLMASFGIIVLHFSPRQLRQESSVVVDRIRRALEQGRQRPALPIRTIPLTSATPKIP